jgi:hypothetical protein
VLRGPDPERDGVSSWQAKDLCRLVEQRFGVVYSENGMLRLLHQKRARSTPKPIARPRCASKKFPVLIAEIARGHRQAERLEVWFLDEMRVGQTGRVCRR